MKSRGTSRIRLNHRCDLAQAIDVNVAGTLPEDEQKAWLDGVSFPRAAGCVGYDIVRATDAADHFVVIESWPSKGARLAHTLETDGYEDSVYSDATLEAVFLGPGT